MRVLLPLLLACAALEAQNTADIEGQVVSSLRSAPLKGALVVLSAAEPAPNTRASWAGITDENGKFAVRGIAPGEYRMRAMHDGFAPFEYQGGKPFKLSAGDSRTGFDFKLESQGAITGLLLDPDNQPIAGLDVMALQRRYINGIKQYVEQEHDTSGPDGRYTIDGLPAGFYYVSTVSTAKAHFVPTYFPSGTDLTAAVALDIRPGAVAEGINLHPIKAQLPTLRAKVINRTGIEDTATVTLLPRASITVGVRRQTRLAPGQQDFVFTDVPPGSYLLTAEVHESNDRVTNGRFGYTGRMIVTIGENAPDNVVLAIDKGIDIPGHLRVEDGKIPDLTTLEVRLPVADLEGRTIGFPAKGPIDAEGTFVVTAASLESHLANVVGLPPGYYIKSFKSGGLDLLTNDLDLTPGIAAPLEIVVSGKAATLTGIVNNRDDKPIKGAVIAIVPETPAFRNHSRFFASTVTRDDGRFVLDRLTPGEYKVYAFEKVEEGAWINAEFRAPYEPSAIKVTLREGSSETANLKLIPAQ